MGRAKGPKKTAQPPEAREGSGRLSNGRFAPGASGCPGGRYLEVHRFARRIRAETKNGDELIDHALKVLRCELKEQHVVTEGMGDGISQARVVETSPSIKEQQAARSWLRENGWGKALPASELMLPEELQEEPSGETSTQAQLTTAQRLITSLLIRSSAALDAGQSPSGEAIAALSTAVQTLATLAKEERELAKAGAGAALSDAELSAQAIAAVPDDVLRAEVERRKGVTP